MADVIEGEIVDDETLPVLHEAPTPTLFGTDDPGAVIEAAKRAAEPLVDVIRKQNLSVKIGPSEHVRVEGWTLLGSMLGVFPFCVWTRKIDGDDGGWEARVEARTRGGDLVGAAEAECLRSEKTWAKREDYMLRSMAQTRATSKALRQPLGFVMQLAGFNPTPAEEMPRDSGYGEQQNVRLISGDQHKKLEAMIGELKVERQGVKDRYGVEHMTDLTIDQARDALDVLERMKSKREDDAGIPF